MTHALRFFDDYGSGWLWGGDALAFQTFDVGPLDDLLQTRLACFSPETLSEAAALSDLHAATLNMADPLSPLPLTAAFCQDFNARADALLARMRAELGPGFTVSDERQPHLP